MTTTFGYIANLIVYICNFTPIILTVQTCLISKSLNYPLCNRHTKQHIALNNFSSINIVSLIPKHKKQSSQRDTTKNMAYKKENRQNSRG